MTSLVSQIATVGIAIAKVGEKIDRAEDQVAAALKKMESATTTAQKKQFRELHDHWWAEKSQLRAEKAQLQEEKNALIHQQGIAYYL